MTDHGPAVSRHGLDRHGLRNIAAAHWNLGTPALYGHALRRGEGTLAQGGALVVLTGQHTGRSPNDKFIVEEPSTRDDIWWGEVNAGISKEKFERLHAKVLAYFEGRELFVQDVFAGADADYRLNVRVVSESAWHALFAHNMFIQPARDLLGDFVPDFTVLHAPYLSADPATDGTNSGTFIVIDFAQRLVLVGGSSYAGEIKKSIFSVLHRSRRFRSRLMGAASRGARAQWDQFALHCAAKRLQAAPRKENSTPPMFPISDDNPSRIPVGYRAHAE